MLDKKSFYPALSLRERATNAKQETQISFQEVYETEPKIKWWTKRYYQGKKPLLHKHLREIGTKPEQLGALLSNHGSGNDGAYLSCEKSWEDFEGLSIEAQDVFQKHGRQSGYGFEGLCEPLFFRALKRVAQALMKLQSSGIVPDGKRLLEEYEGYFAHRIANVMLPCMTVEANLFRIRNKGASSASPEDRFCAFVESLDEEENQKQFWNKYPVLWRLVSTVAKNTVNASIEALERLAEDKTKIESSLGASLQTLNSVQWGTGDAHCGGHVVAILHFGGAKLVYKPRPLAADVAYNAFLDWFAENSDAPSPKSIRILDCGAYGYSAYVEPETEATLSEISVYYKKIGSLLAISWLLGITDLHHENLIASGSDPYLIDVEVMFDRPLRHPRKGAFFQKYYLQAFEDLLFRTGLLPYRLMGPGGVYDLSAIGASGEQPAPTEALMMENIGRDDARFVMQKVSVPEEKNVPHVNGVPCRAHEYLEDIVAGYEHAISVFEKHRLFLLGAKSVLNAFRAAPVRYVTRNTRDYVHILQSMAHPSVLGDAVETDMMIGGELWAGVSLAPHLQSIVASEVEDLWNGDVPYFWTTMDSRDIFSSKGRTHNNFFACTGFQAVKRRLQSLDKLLVPQRETICMALKSTMPAKKEETPSYPISLSKTIPVSTDELVHEAMKIGQSLVGSACYIKDTPVWSGLLPVDKDSYTADVPRLSLYDGTPGIGLFLGYLYRQTGDSRFQTVAADVLATIRKVFADRCRGHGIGAFSGIAGLIYADFLLSSSLGYESSDKIDGAFSLLNRLVKKDETNDLIYGAAGVLLIALRIHRLNGSKEALAVAVTAAKRLSDSAEKQSSGVAWKTVESEEKRLGGLSHGVTGIAWALSEWAQHTKDEKCTELARQAFAYEHGFFDKEQKTWLDARSGAATCHWCYGAPGIGLALQNMSSVLGKDFCDEHIRLACDATWRHGLIDNQCLCHGNFGNSEIFLAVGDHGRANAILAAIMADYRKTGSWNCGMPGNATMPGLMCGLAGIGYGLLRHAAPEQTPGILSLELP